MAETERVDRPSLALAPDPGVARRSRDPSPAPSSLLGLGRDRGAIFRSTHSVSAMMAKTEWVDWPSLALAPDPGVARRSRDPSPAPSSLLGLGRDRGAIFRSTHSVSAMRRRLF